MLAKSLWSVKPASVSEAVSCSLPTAPPNLIYHFDRDIWLVTPTDGYPPTYGSTLTSLTQNDVDR